SAAGTTSATGLGVGVAGGAVGLAGDSVLDLASVGILESSLGGTAGFAAADGAAAAADRGPLLARSRSASTWSGSRALSWFLMDENPSSLQNSRTVLVSR